MDGVDNAAVASPRLAEKKIEVRKQMRDEFIIARLRNEQQQQSDAELVKEASLDEFKAIAWRCATS